MSVGGRVFVWANVSVEGELAEERSHAACHASHRAKGREHHRLDVGMMVERGVDAATANPIISLEDAFLAFHLFFIFIFIFIPLFP